MKQLPLSGNSVFVRKEKLFAPLLNLIAILLLAAILFLLELKNSTVTLVYTCCVFSLMAASLNVTMGFMGQLALGHCGFMAVGAYLGTYLANALKASGFYTSAKDGTYLAVLLLCVVVGGLGAALVGFVVGMPALRLKGDYLAIITLGFGLIVTSVLNNIARPVLYAEDCGLYISGKDVRADYMILIVLLTALCLALIFTFIRSKFGRALESIRDDGIAASASGINISLYKVLGFTFSAFFAGVAGVFYAAMMSSLSTSSFAFSNSGIYNSVFIVVMVVMGGMGSLTGSIVTGVGMVLLNSVISKIPHSIPVLGALAKFPMLLYALVLVVFIMFRPRGIFGTGEFSLYRTLCCAPAFFKSLPSRIKEMAGKLSRKKSDELTEKEGE